MTIVSTPPPPSAPGAEPTAVDFNKWAKFWFYIIGVNVIPAKTQIKKTFVHWKEEGYQTNPIPEETFQKWLDNNEFRDGMAVMAGRVWRGPNAGKYYFIFIDLDNQLAIKEFCTRNGKTVTLQEIAEKFIIEQHADNPNKAHVFFYSKKPFIVKASDNGKPGFDRNTMPMFEVKGDNGHGIAYCTPSIHQKGHPIKIIGTTDPITLDTQAADDLMLHINDVCKRYGLHYLNDKNDTNDVEGTGRPTVEELVEEGSVVIAGNNRHLALVQIGMSIYSYLRGKYPISTIKRMILVANEIYCKPPLDEQEFEKNVWRSITKYIPPNAELEALAIKNLKKIEESSGVDPNQIKEKSLLDVTRYNSGEFTVSKVKIIGVSPPYKMILSVTIKCKNCGDEKVEDHSDMPLMSYQSPRRIRCAVCDEASDVSVSFDHIEAYSITVQDAAAGGGGDGDDLKRLHVILLDELTRNIKVGEIATITGKMTVLNPTGAGGKKATAAMYASQLKYEREEESPITEDDITVFRDFVKKYGSDTPNELVKMFAPQVIGHNDAKLGILRSIVSVKEAKHITGFRTRVHSDLAGDPGTVKSMLAYEATKVALNSEWVTSDHATIKSTLAIVDKDPDTGGAMLMLGPIPRAKNSICSIDEIGSTSFEDQQHYANILEEGRFKKIAYGRDYDIDSPTTIICTTNPTGGYWDKTSPPSLDQIPIKSNIKDRIDQHYIFQDYETDEECRDFAMQKTENYLNPESVKADYDLLKRFLQYAASLPVPKLTPEAASMLSFFWQRMRKAGYMSNRSFDGLHRIALAQARLHLKSEVDVEIVKEVMKDMQIMYVKLGKLVDPSVEDPRILAYNEVIQHVNTLSFPIDFTETLKHVYEHNELVKHYLGHKNVEWRTDYNKKVRAIHDKFTDGGIGQLKQGSNGLAVAIHSISPLTLVKAEVSKKGQQHQIYENQQKMA